MESKITNYSVPTEYQSELGKMNILGFWIFIAAEIILFATLFALYGVYHNRTAEGPTGPEVFVIRDVMIQTILLLTSSFTCGYVITSLRKGKVKSANIWIGITLLFGLGFLVMEINEFIHYAHAGLTIQTSAFGSSLLTLLGTHGAHVTFGVVWAILLAIQLVQRGITPITASKVHIWSIYWHFLDVVWIFIFTFVYLGGLM
ncbi:cytochrome aa3 quinol oxidase subunit III [Caldibacillus thermolactis]|jgi:cytochrome aa3-600 menaquinol oxidase subunit III|uniref:Quinol oxidase subunit 3 n=1 Tax=Pallidibacillus thermolactis TaxID=251051 RepID=A0ABT2WJT6_9BACI|nr:cytochrome aa3 quinol oxidase subunit III [Pallidibacillus thermolactis]MCU9595850.1 cytochrome aa3 quinol oxidase subunit III [Pallidibacillus thermolactis]